MSGPTHLRPLSIVGAIHNGRLPVTLVSTGKRATFIASFRGGAEMTLSALSEGDLLALAVMFGHMREKMMRRAEHESAKR
jgi:hypothetical protein